MLEPASCRRIQFLGCEILFREACRLAAECPQTVDVSFLPKGLHSLETSEMVSSIQEAVDAVDPSVHDAVLLGYARCNDGLVGVQARSIPLVIPRAHDCITFFFGHRQAYLDAFHACPGTYYMTSGWFERGDENLDQQDQPIGQLDHLESLGGGIGYQELVAKYGEENARYVAETLGGWQENYTRMLYLRMGVCDEEPFVEASRRRAEEKGWAFEQQEGDWSLLRKMFLGPWDDDFVVVQPGQQIVARNDGEVLDATSL